MITENYTMTLYEIINNFYTRAEVEGWFKDYELSDYLTEEQIQVVTENGLWSKDKLASKIVDHYLMEQIGFETIGLFKHKVKITMKEIMESKLPLIYSRAIEYDPLVNVDYTETFARTIENEGNSSSESSSNSSGLNVGSDTPQGQINKTDILNGTYASGTNASETESSINDSTEATNNTEENYTKRVKGNSGVSATAQKMVEQFRQNIRAIDYEIIQELEDLFMIIY
jgi:hypothetical protein